jgi:UbiD family decarboxylase
MAEFPFKSLRDWMKFLEDKEELVHNKTEVNLEVDVSAIAYKACRESAPAVIHENIKGYPGWRVLSGTFNTMDRMAYALGVERETMLKELAPKLDVHVPPMEVSTGPCKEIKIFGDDIDLTKIPIPFTGEFEGTPNITAGMSNIRDPETGWQNIAVRRFGLKGKRRLSEFINPTQQDFMIWGKYRRVREKMPIAIIIGPDPCTYLASQAKAPVGFCEYDLVGAFTGMPLEVVKCETSDLLVPADAEIVIEGDVDPYVRELDGPFPEMVGYYTTVASVARVDVKAVTMRKDPIYYYLNMGMKPTEGHAIGELMFAITFYRELTKQLPGILDVRSINWNSVAVKVDKKISKAWPQYAAAVGNILKFVASPAIKLVIVVDEDCDDLENQDDLFNAIWSKFQASKDITIIPRTTGTVLDPSEPWAGSWGWTDFMIMDCTEPSPPYDEGYKRGKAVPTAEALRKVTENWEKYGFKK